MLFLHRFISGINSKLPTPKKPNFNSLVKSKIRVTINPSFRAINQFNHFGSPIPKYMSTDLNSNIPKFKSKCDINLYIQPKYKNLTKKSTGKVVFEMLKLIFAFWLIFGAIIIVWIWALSEFI